MSKTRLLTGFPKTLCGSTKRKAQDLIRLKSEKYLSESLGGFAIQFSKFLPSSLLPSLSKNKRKRVFTDEVTFWAGMSQTLDFNASCSKALSRVQAWRASAGLSPISSKTTAYCNARKRLGIDFIQSVSNHLIKLSNQRVRSEHLWHGHIVMSVDGSEIQLMDTEENQKEYPQPTTQKKNCGFPIMKFLGLLNHCTGAWEPPVIKKRPKPFPRLQE